MIMLPQKFSSEILLVSNLRQRTLVILSDAKDFELSLG